MDNNDGLLSLEDGFAIGTKIAEMADRVKAANKIVPGARAKWCFKVDGQRFEVIVAVAP